MNSNTTSSQTSNDQAPIKPRAKATIKDDRTYTQALVNLLAAEVRVSWIEDEDSAEHDAATRAVCTAWDALAAIVDAWAARQ